MRSRLISSLVVVSMTAVALPALAASKSMNTGPFPDTCDIRGTNYYSGTYRAVTWEDENCARLEAILGYRNPAGQWITKTTAWQTSSMVDTGYFPGTNGDYTDHNGDNDMSGIRYGFRILTPGA